MRHYPRIEMDAGGNHDFPRLARESGFYFNIYRGRIDWKQMDSLDVDRLIQVRDLESLQSVFSIITSCNLSNEYDVKVLDPNFVKLFRLAQLSVDYLQYCRNYLDHCIIVLQEQLQVALHEVEQLQQEKQTKEDEIKQLTKKLKAKFLVNNGLSTKAADYGTGISGISCGINSGISQTPFRCIPCGKMFVSAIFLQRHILRRHPEQVQINEAEKLRLEVHQLQERLQKAEELLKRSSCQVEAKKGEAASKDVVDKSTQLEKVDKAQNTDENLSLAKAPQDTQERRHQSEEDIRSLMENFKRQSEEIDSLRNQLKSQHFAQESLLQNRLEQLEQRHHSDIDALRTSISQPNSLTLQPASNSVHLREPQAQISQPEMVMMGTQVESIPKRPQPVQEAFTKSTSNHFTSTPPKHIPPSLSRRDPMKTESPTVQSSRFSSKEHPASMQPAIHQLQTAEQTKPSTSENQQYSRLSGDFLTTSGSQQYSRMSADLSTTESSTEESSFHTNLSKKDERETDESSNTFEDGIKELSSLANQPQVLASLRDDIEGVFHRSLRELGIDPEWNGIPNATYQSIKATLQHQRGITQKGRRDLVKLREEISREVENKAKTILASASPQKESVPVRKVPARPPPPRSFFNNKHGNEYTAEPRRERPVKPTVVYEEVKNKEENSVRVESEPEAPVPPSRRLSLEKSSAHGGKSPLSKPPVPVPPPRMTPTTAALLADMEKLRQQGTLLKSEGSSLTKSSLKSSSSAGSIAKKRVVFLDEKDDFPTVELGLNDSEFGMFQTRNSTSESLNHSNKAQSFSAGNVPRDITSNSVAFSTNGSGEPVLATEETNVVKMARDFERQLLNKPLSSQFSRSFDHRSSQLDLILDDLSSS